MNIDQLDKDESIKKFVINPSQRLGEKYFDIVDHWKEDFSAIGLGNPDDHRFLVYISTFGNEEGFYDIHLELPPSSNVDFPYTDAGQYTSVSFEKVVELIRDHLKKGGL